MYGLRFCHAPVWQYLAALSGGNETATSGGVPPLIARWIAWSSLPPTCLTVIQGYLVLTELSTPVRILYSRAEKLLHTVSVIGWWLALGLTVCAGPPPPPPPAVQAAL